MPQTTRQNITVSLTKQTIRRAKLLAARQSTSISGLLEKQIKMLVGEEEEYEIAHRQALNLMDKGLRLGGARMIPREELHRR